MERGQRLTGVHWVKLTSTSMNLGTVYVAYEKMTHEICSILIWYEPVNLSQPEARRMYGRQSIAIIDGRKATNTHLIKPSMLKKRWATCRSYSFV